MCASSSELNFFAANGLSVRIWRRAMLVLLERGRRVMNVRAMGYPYPIASNYLCRTGAIADSFATNDRLLEIIVQLFERGEFNKIRIANKGMAKFEAEEMV